MWLNISFAHQTERVPFCEANLLRLQNEVCFITLLGKQATGPGKGVRMKQGDEHIGISCPHKWAPCQPALVHSAFLVFIKDDLALAFTL